MESHVSRGLGVVEITGLGYWAWPGVFIMENNHSLRDYKVSGLLQSALSRAHMRKYTEIQGHT